MRTRLAQEESGDDGARNTRDASMAENVAWILRQNPGAKLVLWAHNEHISRRDGAMGYHLARMFGSDYLPVGFATRQGSYVAHAADSSGLGNHTLQVPPWDNIEGCFAATGESRLILNLAHAVEGSRDSGWLTEPRPFRFVGGMAMDPQFYPQIVTKSFDVLIYIETTTPTALLNRGASR